MRYKRVGQELERLLRCDAARESGLSSNHSIELGVVNSGSNQADVNIQGKRYGSWGIIGGPRHGDT